MMIKGHVDARPWKPQDLIDDLQKMIDEEPDAYLNDRCTTLCTARDYLKEYFNTYLPEQKKAIDNGLPLHYYPVYRKALRDLKDGTSHRILHLCSSCVISAFQTRNQELFSVF